MKKAAHSEVTLLLALFYDTCTAALSFTARVLRFLHWKAEEGKKKEEFLCFLLKPLHQIFIFTVITVHK